MPAKRATLDELYLTVRVPAGLPPETTAEMTRVLAAAGFRRRLRRAVARVYRRYPELARASVRLT